ncbi:MULTISPECIES: type V toxin-antitoxin system endoribonuclease antitoxin GhoS [unclassified Serratia (in: enterobacteria)]|uniref:type V toxin-antitoxin system endoribonuclease antitoxin GhoS n=1 Tax=unclassified Serratia (in: enterobacteria) TaxID=2647522 RepID=UPI0005004901|nr:MULTISPECIES: type V toxin-antitoxin system endoribonuclease antitoxin GhoS [unclassified Serratia (in: enterobacteria)]KFK94784.1 hypothetical protein JV45_12855 [Serratia sp. Ag2]KFK99056.1 hypothetical protein IV04_08615 [Serratia sp. Ag1]
MSQSPPTCFVVTFNVQEDGFVDLSRLSGQLTREGFTTSITDERGVHHQLEKTSFALTTPLDQQIVQQLAQGFGHVALGKPPQVSVATSRDYVKRLHIDT